MHWQVCSLECLLPIDLYSYFSLDSLCVTLGCFTKPPGLKLEPLSGLSCRLVPDPMLLEDTSIVEMGRSVTSSEMPGEAVENSAADTLSVSL